MKITIKSEAGLNVLLIVMFALGLLTGLLLPWWWNAMFGS